MPGGGEKSLSKGIYGGFQMTVTKIHKLGKKWEICRKNLTNLLFYASKTSDLGGQDARPAPRARA